VDILGVQALLAKLAIKVCADPCCWGATGQPPATDLSQAAQPYTAPKRETDLPIHEPNEGETLTLKLSRNVIAVASGGEHIISSQQLDGFASVGLHMTDDRLVGCGQSPQQTFDGQVAIGGDQGRRENVTWS
jgi:hypothetical protein